LSIKSRQVAGVTTLVVLIVAALSAYHLSTLARLSLKESASRGELLKQAIYQRAREVVPTAQDPYAALQQDGGIRSLLDSSVAYSANVTYAAITNKDGIAVAHNFVSEEGRLLPEQDDLQALVDQNPIALLRAAISDRTYEVRQPLLFGDQQFGTIRIGVSTILVKGELRTAFWYALQSVIIALILSTIVAMVMAQWIVRPIHVIQSGLTRLGRGELDVRLDLPESEFKDLGSSFAAVSAQLSESRAKAITPSTDFESIVDNLEDAVALFSPEGQPLFCNPAMNTVLGGFETNDTVRDMVARTLASRKPEGPMTLQSPEARGELMLITHPIDDGHGKFMGAMLVARNLGFMTQVHSTLNYSRKLAALGRLMAGVAHEVKNPLNAMTIHLELLKNKLSRADAPVVASVSASSLGSSAPSSVLHPPSSSADVSKHVDIIAKEIRRLDQVLNGFLRFARPDELKLQPTQLAAVVSDVITTVAPEADRMHVTVKHECPPGLPAINADQAMLRQALLNLALNSCQAMPDGGALRIVCRAARDRVEVDVEDTGIGIPPENLEKIFDLYFTTKERGTGIGLSMVYRIVQLHDGEIEVQSTPGSGTRFRLVFPQA